MEFATEIATTIVAQLQKPTLAFLIGGMMLAALGSRIEVPEPVYKFIVMLLLLKVGLGAGISVREADLAALAVPAVLAAIVGVVIVLGGRATLARWRGVSEMDGMATAGLFGAVSASTLAAGMAMLDAEGIAYEGFIGALYPFMDIAALVTAIVLARMSAERRAARTVQGGGAATMTLGGGRDAGGGGLDGDLVKTILVDTARSPAISALLLGLAIGILGRPESVYAGFYEPLFRGLLSVLMLVMGIEAWQRLSELRKVAHAYVLYGIAAPLVHGLIGFGAGMVAHHLTGFSAGGVVLLSVMAASSSDISGPPTLRGALPEANPSAYVGTSTGLGTPVAILSIPLWIALAGAVIGV
ncbi:sodium-dependent bicarbonate transport family permease [Roseibacterium sp. SDUM158017]|uniref:sodium-dependent bicarbonate transport family permease n=1 Tax=Roseicyclus salinarum TaxID=3036773 RepID=UPI0024155CEC|nr:sodium-dependent bicarbonate transport family permease [Roseibacterium sp. SDUM158017]MDG4647392.1 sodium-dependent bicarbonate transport family permease [Roseibacterium sp. SDUM158017]